MSDSKRWEKAKEHFDEVRLRYTQIGAAGLPALQFVFTPLLIRYERGERTKELLEQMESVE